MNKKREKFIELAERRVNKALKQLELIGNLANKSNYEYEKTDYKKMFRAIDEELKSMKHKFTEAHENKSKFKLKK